MQASVAQTSISSPEDCFSYCGINGGIPAPYFFNWNTVTNQCFCCGGECTLVVDQAFTAYVATVTATAAPTAFNTTGSRRRLMAQEDAATVAVHKGKLSARRNVGGRMHPHGLAIDSDPFPIPLITTQRKPARPPMIASAVRFWRPTVA